MRKPSLLMRTFVLLTLCCFVTSCNTVVPNQFAALEQAFPPNEPLGLTSGIPSDSFKRAQFEAPFEDVFRAITISATQAQMNVEVSDKKKGVILATRETQKETHNDFKLDYVHNSRVVHFYSITLKELSPKSSEVVVTSKAQWSCIKAGVGVFLVDVALIIIVVGLMALGIHINNNNACDKGSSVHWASGIDNSAQEMSQLITFTRNNLLAAGIL